MFISNNNNIVPYSGKIFYFSDLKLISTYMVEFIDSLFLTIVSFITYFR